MTAVSEKCLAGCGTVTFRWRLCEPCGYALASMCYGKKRFRTKEHVAKVRRGNIWADQRPYQCLVCSTHHFGRASGRVADKTAQAAQVIQAIRSAGNGWILGWLADQWTATDHRDRMTWKHRSAQMGW